MYSGRIELRMLRDGRGPAPHGARMLYTPAEAHMGQPFESFARVAIRAYACRAVRRQLTLDISGTEHLPAAGPALLAARHYHHLYDGLILLGCLPRPVHLLVALDWVRDARTRRFLELACSGARWPIVLRPENLRHMADADDPRDRGAFATDEIGPYLRRALRDATDLFRDGRVLALFPEGYPNVDPRGSRKPGPHDFLPFQPGFLTLIEHAQRALETVVPIVPIGFAYEDGESRVTMRLGDPLYHRSPSERASVLRDVEQRVRTLSHDDECGTAAARDELWPDGVREAAR